MKTISRNKHVLRAAGVAALMPLVFVAAFIIPTHTPKANDLPVAVAGPPAAARALLRPLGDVKVVRVSSAAVAAHAVRHRTAYGAVITGPHPAVYIASGESFVAATLIKQDAIEAGIPPTEIKDLAPLATGDPRNTTLNLVVLALLVAGIVGSTLIIMATRELGRWRPEAVLVGIALTAGTAAVGLLKAYSALPGSFAAEAALFAGFIFAVSLFADGLVRLKGQMGTSLSFLVFLVIANPGSGLATAPDLLPAPWRQFGPFMPPGAWGQAVRGTAYFGSAADLRPILVLAAWILVGCGLVVLGYRRARPAGRAPEPRVEVAAPSDGIKVAVPSSRSRPRRQFPRPRKQGTWS